MSLKDHYTDFARKIRWCNRLEKHLLLQLEKNKNDKKLSFIIKKVSEYKRDCNIICRNIELYRSKKSNLPTNYEQRLTTECFILRFRKFQTLKEILQD